MRKKGGIVFEEIPGWVELGVVLGIIFLVYIAMSSKGGNLLEAIKNIFTFGK